jgi:uncharacterized protein YceK
MYSRPLIVMAMLLFIVVLSGCASIMHGSKQEISFESTPAGASVEVFDARGASFGACMTPCKLDLKRKNEYKVVFSKSGYQSVELLLDRGSDGWIWGNILFGGVIGLIVDFSNGSAYKLKPEHLSTVLPAAAQTYDFDVEDGEQVVIIDIDDLTTGERGKLDQLELVSLTLR